MGAVMAARPNPKSVSIANEVKAVTESAGQPSPTDSVSTYRSALCSSTSPWKCSPRTAQERGGGHVAEVVAELRRRAAVGEPVSPVHPQPYVSAVPPTTRARTFHR